MAWLDPWPCRVALVSDPTKVGAGGVSNFPAYLNGAVLPAQVFSFCLANGADFRLTAADGTTLYDYELVSIDRATGALELHWKVPSLSSASAVYNYLYFGNRKAVSAANPHSLWSDYALVAHMSEAASPFVDSSPNARTGTWYGASTGKTGKLYASGGQQFAGASTEWLSWGTYSSPAALTVSGWFNRGNSDNHAVACVWDTAAGSWFAYFAGTALQMSFATGDDHAAATLTSTPGSWEHCSWGADASNIIFCRNGVTETQALGHTLNKALTLRQAVLTGWYFWFLGYMDELRIRAELSTAAWLTTCYNAQNSPQTFWSCGAVERRRRFYVMNPRRVIAPSWA